MEWNPDVKQKQKGKNKTLRIVLRVLYICFAVFTIMAVLAAGVGAGAVSAFAKDEKIRSKEDYDKQLSGWSQTSYTYFNDKKLIGPMLTEADRKLIKSPDEVSHFLIDALISTEDREFYQHNGVVPKSIARAVWQQASGSEVTTGGSTLTQQLVKREIIGDNKKTYARKVLEIINAIRLEMFYNKDEILVKYLNSVELGPGAHKIRTVGFAAAAHGFFNKSVKDLTLPEAAYLAGMVQLPYSYNPFLGEKEVKAGTKRMKYVLTKMLENGKITQAQYDEAINWDITKHVAKASDFESGFSKYPFIITAVEKEAANILKELDKNNPEVKDEKVDYTRKVRQGGYKIYTTIDEQLYVKLNDSLKNMRVPGKYVNGKRVKEQIGATIVDNKTGAVLAFVSGTSFDETQIDHAFNVERQPGSSIKPLLVYGPALNEGLISPDTMIWDEPVAKPDGTMYKNANNKYKNGPVTATYALQWSLNTPAIKLIRKLNVQHAFDYLRKMGMPPHKWDGEASALGGMSQGYTVAQMTAAYAMIANQGVYNKPHLIERIEDSSGNVIYDFKQHNQPKQILSPQAAYQLMQMMREVVRAGTAQKIIGNGIPGYNIAGKTGSTTSYKDLWFVGYTPEISLGVWSGYDDNYKNADHDFSQQVWSRLFKAAAKTKPDLIKAGSNFNNPGGLTSGKCFECGRALPAPEPQPGQPAQPGQQPAQPGQQPAQPGQQPALPGQQPAQPGQPTGEQPQTEQPTGNPQQPPTTGDGGQSQ
ncbi:transglycosylase domain-containing protein [Laceyella putida]|uniref:Transglycosylase domain-containing protein n=1 Tax=Laceyella putida TaxID=110101 RepID=A0ABW2RJV6_9BACL